jgi:diguanylate cyclase (GGDEF)-like protein
VSVEPRTAPGTDRAAPSAWDAVTTAPAVTARLAADALTAMEISRAQYLTEHLPAARRIAAAAADLGRPDLAMRARLVEADVAARQGSPLQASHEIQAVNDWATDADDRYIAARSSFLQCAVQFRIGDLPTARLHGITGVDLLPADAPTSIRVDHLTMLAVAHGPGPAADRCYRRALQLTEQSGDTARSLGLLNNLAFFAWRAGDLATAAQRVEQMRSSAARHDLPLKPSMLDTAARVYTDSGRPDEAVATLRPAVDDHEASLFELGNIGVLHTAPYALPQCQVTLARALRSAGRYDEAERYLDAAARTPHDRILGVTLTELLEERAGLAAARGDWRAAYEQHIVFHDTSTRLHDEEQESRARLIQASYDADERRRDTVRFRELAMRDALTGLYNRRFIDEQLRSLTSRAAAARTPLSAAIVDADFFKRINDECSHDVGDAVLRTMSSILSATVVAPETVGRLGGEEFVILMPDVSAEDAAMRCEQVRYAIARHDWSPLVGAIPITVSIGVATAGNGQTSPAAILSDADRNLYAAKRSGRNRVVSDSR